MLDLPSESLETPWHWKHEVLFIFLSNLYIFWSFLCKNVLLRSRRRQDMLYPGPLCCQSIPTTARYPQGGKAMLANAGWRFHLARTWISWSAPRASGEPVRCGHLLGHSWAAHAVHLGTSLGIEAGFLLGGDGGKAPPVSWLLLSKGSSIAPALEARMGLWGRALPWSSPKRWRGWQRAPALLLTTSQPRSCSLEGPLMLCLPSQGTTGSFCSCTRACLGAGGRGQTGLGWRNPATCWTC